MGECVGGMVVCDGMSDAMRNDGAGEPGVCMSVGGMGGWMGIGNEGPWGG